jgi:hypothetical protein
MNYSPMILSDYNGLYSLKGTRRFAKRGELNIEHQQMESDLGEGIHFSCVSLNVEIRWYKAKMRSSAMGHVQAVDTFETLFRTMMADKPMIAFINWIETVRYLANMDGKQEVRSLILKAMGYNS